MRKFDLPTTLALMLLTAVSTFIVSFYAIYEWSNKTVNNFAVAEAQYDRIAEVEEKIKTLYVNEYDMDKVMEGALAGMIYGLGDPWSHYLTPEEFSEYIDSFDDSLVGIGVNAIIDYSANTIKIQEVYPNSPAEAAGIKANDMVIKVDGQAIEDIGCAEAVDKIRGEKGTMVEIVVERPNVEGELTFSATRDEVKKVNATGKFASKIGFDETEYGKIGYIQISEFGTGSAEQIKKAINNLQNGGAVGIVFDLRNNPGGQLDELVPALDLILPEGLIIRTEDKAGNVVTYDSDADEINLPMAVIVNSRSYSAAEFFAASLQEKGKAVVVGEHTIGKGCAQRAVPLENGDAIVISVDKYYTANNVSLADTKGIAPDIEVSLTEEQEKNYYELGASDPQIKAALDYVKSQIK